MAYGQPSSELKTAVGVGVARKCAMTHLVALLLVAALVLAGCSGSRSGTYGDALSLVAEESGPGPALDGDAPGEVVPDLHDLGRQELRDGPAVRQLGVARLLREVGAIELLDRYIVNLPTGAYFLHNFEIQAAMSASTWSNRDEGDRDDVTHTFEQQVLIAVDGGALNRLPTPDEPDPLHDAFYEVFEQCGRESPWPDVELADRKGNSGGDVLFIDPELGISQFEYRELLHACGRYAATYPTLDPEIRDELLAPQRTYFARKLLDRLDNEMPVVQVPAKYQAEVDELRRNGW